MMADLSGVYGPDAVKRGGAGLGIGEQYPVSVYGPPQAKHGGATWEDLREAGFDRPGDGPTFVGPDGEEHPLFFFVLRDMQGIVATWDEGRWWTPRESAAFTASMLHPAVRMLAETTHAIETENRETRRRRRRR